MSATPSGEFLSTYAYSDEGPHFSTTTSGIWTSETSAIPLAQSYSSAHVDPYPVGLVADDSGMRGIFRGISFGTAPGTVYDARYDANAWTAVTATDIAAQTEPAIAGNAGGSFLAYGAVVPPGTYPLIGFTKLGASSTTCAMTHVGSGGPTVVAPSGSAPSLLAVYASPMGYFLRIRAIAGDDGVVCESEENFPDSPLVQDGERAALVALPNGDVVLAARAFDGHAVWTSYQDGAWNAFSDFPASGAATAPIGPVSLAAGVCGYDAIAAWPTASEGIYVSYLDGATRTWTNGGTVDGTASSKFGAIATHR